MKKKNVIIIIISDDLFVYYYNNYLSIDINSPVVIILYIFPERIYNYFRFTIICTYMANQA